MHEYLSLSKHADLQAYRCAEFDIPGPTYKAIE